MSLGAAPWKPTQRKVERHEGGRQILDDIM